MCVRVCECLRVCDRDAPRPGSWLHSERHQVSADSGGGPRPGLAGAGPGCWRARARRGLGPAGYDDRQRPGPGRALGGESVPGPRTPAPATPPNLAPACAPEEPSRWVRGAPALGGQKPRGLGRAPLAGGKGKRAGGRAPSQTWSCRAGGGGRRSGDR